MAGSLDLSIGGVIVALAYALLGDTATLPFIGALAVLALGAVFGVLPDFDIMGKMIRWKPIRFNHRHTLLHRPAFLLPLVALCGWLFGLLSERFLEEWFVGAWFWCIVTILCVLWHFIHDTPPLSVGGIAWLWPFSKRYCSLKGLEESHPEPDSDWRELVRAHWLVPTYISELETWGASVAAGLAFGIMFRDIFLGLAVATACIAAVNLVWFAYERYERAH